MPYETYKTRLFRRLTDTCASLPDPVLINTFHNFSAQHAQLLLSLLPMNTISRLSYLMKPSFFQDLATDELPENRTIELATEILAHLNDATVNAVSDVTEAQVPTTENVTPSVKVLDFIARRMGRLTIKG